MRRSVHGIELGFLFYCCFVISAARFLFSSLWFIFFFGDFGALVWSGLVWWVGAKGCLHAFSTVMSARSFVSYISFFFFLLFVIVHFYFLLLAFGFFFFFTLIVGWVVTFLYLLFPCLLVSVCLLHCQAACCFGY